MEIEPPDEFISIARAAEISGLSPHTLRNQARTDKLRTKKLGHDLVTNRRWLHAYLINRDDSRGGHAASLPENYQVPESAQPDPVGAS